jgi:hypothetical protein
MTYPMQQSRTLLASLPNQVLCTCSRAEHKNECAFDLEICVLYELVCSNVVRYVFILPDCLLHQSPKKEVQ